MATSLPARGVWIEIMVIHSKLGCWYRWSLPARGVWIEIKRIARHRLRDPSLPARGVWIEIVLPKVPCVLKLVAPRKGSVD